LSVSVSRLSVFDMLRKNLPMASDVLIASPWITEQAAEPLLPLLQRKPTTVVCYPKLAQRDEGPELLREHGARLYSGPVHAKLYLLRRNGDPFLAVFGSENLTRTRNEELVMASTDRELNGNLVGSFGRFLSRCYRI